MIINGHIHKPLRSEYENNPVYLCPFTPSGCVCKIEQTSNSIEIKQTNFGLKADLVTLDTPSNTHNPHLKMKHVQFKQPLPMSS